MAARLVASVLGCVSERQLDPDNYVFRPVQSGLLRDKAERVLLAARQHPGQRIIVGRRHIGAVAAVQPALDRLVLLGDAGVIGHEHQPGRGIGRTAEQHPAPYQPRGRAAKFGPKLCSHTIAHDCAARIGAADMRGMWATQPLLIALVVEVVPARRIRLGQRCASGIAAHHRCLQQGARRRGVAAKLRGDRAGLRIEPAIERRDIFADLADHQKAAVFLQRARLGPVVLPPVGCFAYPVQIVKQARRSITAIIGIAQQHFAQLDPIASRDCRVKYLVRRGRLGLAQPVAIAEMVFEEIAAVIFDMQPVDRFERGRCPCQFGQPPDFGFDRSLIGGGAAQLDHEIDLVQIDRRQMRSGGNGAGKHRPIARRQAPVARMIFAHVPDQTAAPRRAFAKFLGQAIMYAALQAQLQQPLRRERNGRVERRVGLSLETDLPRLEHLRDEPARSLSIAHREHQQRTAAHGIAGGAGSLQNPGLNLAADKVGVGYHSHSGNLAQPGQFRPAGLVPLERLGVYLARQHPALG